MVVRQYEDELKYIEKINDYSYRIKKGFQPNMNVEGVFYVNKHLENLMFEELKNSCRPGMDGGFLPGLFFAFCYSFHFPFKENDFFLINPLSIHSNQRC